MTLAAFLVFATTLNAQVPSSQAASQSSDDSEARPAVTKTDVKIVQRARQILDSAAKWDRADTRTCPPHAQTFSIYCALEAATHEITGSFAHRGAAMQEARFVIDEIAPNRNYGHRLMHYNNDPRTTFADIQTFFRQLEARLEIRLKEEPSANRPAAEPVAAKPSPLVTQADVKVVQHARELLASPSKWNRDNTQVCPPNAQTFNLYCALATAEKEVTGVFDGRSAAMREARAIIDETAPNVKKYDSRLVDYNNDRATSFEDIQKLLHTVEDRLIKLVAANRE